MSLTARRCLEAAALLLIGDGIMGIIHPSRDAKAWHYGPEPWKNLMQSLEDRPQLTRALSAVQVAAAVAWVLHSSKQENEAKTVEGGSKRLA